MHSKLQAALCLTHQPVAVYKTHQPPEGSLTMPEESHGCVIALLAAAAKGKTAAFQENTIGCPGGKAGLAFNRDLLASHIRTCVVKDIREGKDEVIDELVLTLQKLMK